MNHSSLSEMVKHIGSLRRISMHIGEYHLHNTEALAWWIHDQRHRNRKIYAEEFDAEIMEASLNELELESKEETGDESVFSKFKDTFTGYIQWEVELINYLSGLKGKSGVPLVYVIHKNAEVPLTGAVFQEDTRQAYHILKAACLGTNGWE